MRFKHRIDTFGVVGSSVLYFCLHSRGRLMFLGGSTVDVSRLRGLPVFGLFRRAFRRGCSFEVPFELE